MSILNLVGDVSNALGVAGAIIAGGKSIYDYHQSKKVVEVSVTFIKRTNTGKLKDQEVIKEIMFTIPKKDISRAEIVGRLAMLVKGGGRMNVSQLQTPYGVRKIDNCKGGELIIFLQRGEETQFGFDGGSLDE